MRLTSFQRGLVRRRTVVQPDDTGGELNVVPFLDIVTNIIMFLLATTQVVLVMSQIDVHLGGSGPARRALDLSLTVVPDGVILATADGKLAPGCRHYASGRVTTVRGYDWRAVTACVAQVKAANPGETDVIISADPQIAYEDVVRAMDATRARATGEPLFPNVQLSAGVR